MWPIMAEEVTFLFQDVISSDDFCQSCHIFFCVLCLRVMYSLFSVQMDVAYICSRKGNLFFCFQIFLFFCECIIFENNFTELSHFRRHPYVV